MHAPLRWACVCFSLTHTHTLHIHFLHAQGQTRAAGINHCLSLRVSVALPPRLPLFILLSFPVSHQGLMWTQSLSPALQHWPHTSDSSITREWVMREGKKERERKGGWEGERSATTPAAWQQHRSLDTNLPTRPSIHPSVRLVVFALVLFPVVTEDTNAFTQPHIWTDSHWQEEWNSTIHWILAQAWQHMHTHPTPTQRCKTSKQSSPTEVNPRTNMKTLPNTRSQNPVA